MDEPFNIDNMLKELGITADQPAEPAVEDSGDKPGEPAAGASSDEPERDVRVEKAADAAKEAKRRRAANGRKQQAAGDSDQAKGEEPEEAGAVVGAAAAEVAAAVEAPEGKPVRKSSRKTTSKEQLEAGEPETAPAPKTTPASKAAPAPEAAEPEASQQASPEPKPVPALTQKSTPVTTRRAAPAPTPQRQAKANDELAPLPRRSEIPSRQSRRTAVSRQQRQTLESKADASQYKPLGMHDNKYYIRGGGFSQLRNPIVMILLGAIVAVALGFGGYYTWQLVNFLAQEQTQESVITITVEEGHQALASTMPYALDYLWGNGDDAYYRLVESGLSIYLNDRSNSNNPDATARGKELLYLPATAIESDRGNYSSSEYNAFDFDVLQNRLLGSWVMDISNGDRGNYLQLKYVNMASEGLFTEMRWLIDRQGLTGDNSVIVNEGTDRFGNSYIEGYVVMEGENYVYWRVLSCAFGEYYLGGDTRRLPDTSAYVKLRIANWDFYGADKAATEPGDLPPDQGEGPEQSPEE